MFRIAALQFERYFSVVQDVARFVPAATEATLNSLAEEVAANQKEKETVALGRLIPELNHKFFPIGSSESKIEQRSVHDEIEISTQTSKKRKERDESVPRKTKKPKKSAI